MVAKTTEVTAQALGSMARSEQKLSHAGKGVFLGTNWKHRDWGIDWLQMCVRIESQEKSSKQKENGPEGAETEIFWAQDSQKRQAQKF